MKRAHHDAMLRVRKRTVWPPRTGSSHLLREAAILQTFPPKYKFVRPDEPVGSAFSGRLIGNAVPVRLGEVVGQTVVAHAHQFARPDDSAEG